MEESHDEKKRSETKQSDEAIDFILVKRIRIMISNYNK